MVRESRTLVSGKLKLHQLQEKFQELPTATCYRTRIGQVFTNLLSNAADALNEKADRDRQRGEAFAGTIAIVTEPAQRNGIGGILVSISDNGDGIAQELREKIFDDFFTTKPAGSGTGLGLPMCKTIIDEHGGTIAVSDCQHLGGARFEVWFPTHLSHKTNPAPALHGP